MSDWYAVPLESGLLHFDVIGFTAAGCDVDLLVYHEADFSWQGQEGGRFKSTL